MEAYINATCFWKQIDMAYRQPIFFLETNLSQISNKFGCKKSRNGLSPTNLSDFFACAHQSGLRPHTRLGSLRGGTTKQTRQGV